MNNKLLLAVSTAILMAVPSLATAHDDEGWYLRGNLGYGIHTEPELSLSLIHISEPTRPY